MITLELERQEAQDVLEALSWRCNEYGVDTLKMRGLYRRLEALIQERDRRRRYGKRQNRTKKRHGNTTGKRKKM